MKGDCTPSGFEHVGQTVFFGKGNQSKKEQGEPEAEEGMCGCTRSVTCDIMDDSLLRLQGAWDNPQQKDECSVRMDDLEWDYWKGTEVGQLGGYGFQGAMFGVDGSCKDGTMGSG
jgi:hypothetical protein